MQEQARAASLFVGFGVLILLRVIVPSSRISLEEKYPFLVEERKQHHSSRLLAFFFSFPVSPGCG
jgi:hypothetical protein